MPRSQHLSVELGARLPLAPSRVQRQLESQEATGDVFDGPTTRLGCVLHFRCLGRGRPCRGRQRALRGQLRHAYQRAWLEFAHVGGDAPLLERGDLAEAS